MEINSCRFQKAILEVVQVKQHAFYIEFRLWITLLKVESNGSPHLHFGQCLKRFGQQLLFFLRVSAASITGTFQHIKQRSMAQIGLKIPQFIVTNSQNLRNRKLFVRKMLREINERMIFIPTGTYHCDHRLARFVAETIINTIAASPFQLLYSGRFLTRPLRIKFYKFLHIFRFFSPLLHGFTAH